MIEVEGGRSRETEREREINTKHFLVKGGLLKFLSYHFPIRGIITPHRAQKQTLMTLN